MTFDPENTVIKLCSQGMMSEGLGQVEEAKALFEKAWTEADTDFEKFIAAHYLARIQRDTNGKLRWDETALEMALKIDSVSIKAYYPSLYLNIGKCHEDLNAFDRARMNYDQAFTNLEFLPEDGYGKMIRAGVLAARERIQSQTK